jgi:hypothetical protein
MAEKIETANATSDIEKLKSDTLTHFSHTKAMCGSSTLRLQSCLTLVRPPDGDITAQCALQNLAQSVIHGALRSARSYVRSSATIACRRFSHFIPCFRRIDAHASAPKAGQMSYCNLLKLAVSKCLVMNTCDAMVEVLLILEDCMCFHSYRSHNTEYSQSIFLDNLSETDFRSIHQKLGRNCLFLRHLLLSVITYFAKQDDR